VVGILLSFFLPSFLLLLIGDLGIYFFSFSIFHSSVSICIGILDFVVRVRRPMSGHGENNKTFLFL
jgi:hypothetical protein